MTSKEYKDNIQVFITEFLDYYRLNDLNFDISCWDLREYSSYSLHIGKIDNFVYQKFNINEYKDRLVSLLQNIITEYNVQTEPSLVNVYSHNTSQILPTLCNNKQVKNFKSNFLWNI